MKITTENLNFAGAGIHENVHLTELRIGMTNSNSHILEYTFTLKDGAERKETLFCPRAYDNTEKSKERSANITAYRMLEIAKLFDETKDFTYSNEGQETGNDEQDWLKFITAYCEKFNKANYVATTPLRLKLVYGKNGFLQVAKGSNTGATTWIERMDVIASEMNINPNDVITPPERSKPIEKQPNDDDLPF
jgi:hypothetical protein